MGQGSDWTGGYIIPALSLPQIRCFRKECDTFSGEWRLWVTDSGDKDASGYHSPVEFAKNRAPSPPEIAMIWD
ncbi:hypothetical protein PM082_011214 [Marasmius tenuissimus]|nr:hypothetical protein PM082_011214 [Marasmius tenuissimus]